MPGKTTGFNKAIRSMQARVKSFKNGDPYDEAGQIASKSIAINVESGGRPQWKKRKGTYSHPILDKTGTMRDSGESSAMKWQHGSIWHVNEIRGPHYGAIHQYTGVRTKQGKSVKKIIRKYVRFQRAEINQMTQAFRKAFLQK